MKIHLEPASGRVMLLPSAPAPGGGGGGGGPARSSFVNIVDSDPLSANEGDLVFNTVDLALKIWYLGAWATLGALDTTPAGTASALTLESGSGLLLEDGDYLLLEA